MDCQRRNREPIAPRNGCASFWATLKKEFVHLCPFDTLERLRAGVFEYVEVYYNRLRIHSTIGYRTPVEFEEEFDEKGDRAA